MIVSFPLTFGLASLTALPPPPQTLAPVDYRLLFAKVEALMGHISEIGYPFQLQIIRAALVN
jgi:hypothetical protein